MRDFLCTFTKVMLGLKTGENRVCPHNGAHTKGMTSCDPLRLKVDFRAAISEIRLGTHWPEGV
jgi:hypothetical protein